MARLSPQTVVLSTVAVVVQFALMILAWGDWTTFFAHPARRWFVIGSILLLIVAWFSGTSGISPGKSFSPSSKRMLVAFFAVFLGMVLVAPYSDRHNLLTIGGDAVRYAGLILFLVGSIFRLGAAFELGHRFSGLVAIQPDHKLKTDGLYRYVRHPSYAGLVVAMIGWALLFRSIICLILNVLLFYLLLRRMADEESFLEAHFGAEYRAYRRKTWRLFPFIY
jgi:protein-S-isoprenylcysteine O-methyltransferase Ste14